jgi:hypothetical protein
MSEKKKIELGNRARCIVTGFTGIAVSRIEYLNGCVQLCIKAPVDKDGKESDGLYIDDQQLEFVDEGIKVQPKNTGGPRTNAPTGVGLANR